MATAQQTCSVKCESYSNSIIPRIYEHLIRGSMGDCVLSAEGKFIRAHKLILTVSSDYFESIFNMANMEKPVIVIGNMKFADLCLILDFAYLGQAQIPSDRLDDFLRAGEMLQIRGIKEGRIHYLNSVQPRDQQTTTINRSFDSTISSTQQETSNEPTAKRAREDDDISIQEASEIMKMLLENNTEIDVDQQQVIKTTSSVVSVTGEPSPFFISKVTSIVPKAQSPAALPPRSGKKSVLGKPKFLCRYCSRGLTTEGRIKKHEKECADNPNREVAICEICNIQVKPSSLSLHKNTKHKPATPKLPSFLAPSTSNESLMAINTPPPLLIESTSEQAPIRIGSPPVPALFGLPIQYGGRELDVDIISSPLELAVGSKTPQLELNDETSVTTRDGEELGEEDTASSQDIVNVGSPEREVKAAV